MAGAKQRKRMAGTKLPTWSFGSGHGFVIVPALKTPAGSGCFNFLFLI